MLRMKDRTEFAWTLLRAAQSVAALQKPIERIASVASLSIIPGLGPEISLALEEWTREEALAWWTAVRAGKASKAASRPEAKKSATGRTIAVALAGRSVS